MKSVGVLDVFCTISERFTTSGSNFLNISIFTFFRFFNRPNPAEFHSAGRISADRYYFCNKYTKISSQKISASMELHSRNQPQVFLKTSQNPIFTIKLVQTWSSSGWVPMVRKVLFHRKVWVLKNILNIHHVFISPIVQKIFTLLGKNLPH